MYIILADQFGENYQTINMSTNIIIKQLLKINLRKQSCFVEAVDTQTTMPQRLEQLRKYFR